MNKQALKLKTLEECPNLAFYDELQSLNGKIESIKTVLKDIKGKESKTYEEEITSLQETLNSLLKTIESKETIVNIPLDKLEISLSRVEKAIRDIKEVKIPEFPNEISIDSEQLDSLLESFEKIPEFPVDELTKAVDKLLIKIDELKKEDEIFDYDRVERKMDLIVKAVKSISITVSGGGDLNYIKNSSGAVINPATQENQATQIANQEDILLAMANISTTAGQDEIVQAIENITIPAPAGGATEAKQNTQIINEGTIISLVETLQELSSRLAFLQGLRGVSADLRVTPLSLPTLSTVTTVATLTNQTNIGGFSASTMVGAAQNNIAIQSNINNVTA